MKKPRRNRTKTVQFTYKQHYLGRQFLKLFSQDANKVYVKIVDKEGVVKQKSVNDEVFYSKKGWDESTERLMKSIEDAFKEEVDKAINNENSFNFGRITDYYLMWNIRGRLASERPESVNFRIIGSELSFEEQDTLEYKGAYFMRPDGTMHDDMFRGLTFKMDLNKLNILFKSRKWGLVKSPEENFILPDFWNVNLWKNDLTWIIPITRDMAFVAEHENGIVTQENACRMNQFSMTHCKNFCVTYS
ncbi:hypothetical protein RCE33_27185 [Klebsiella pneumoniae]|nr:hypothetical protein [Klebsiella pneumoniae]MDQ5576479.1 hypothetical protein [Klebsiella pneumoniae]